MKARREERGGKRKACRPGPAHPQEERRELLARLDAAHCAHAGLTAEMAAHGASDPANYDRKRDAVRVAKKAAERWTGRSDG